MDIAAEVVGFPEGFRDGDDLLHGVVGIADDAGAEEEAFDVVTLVEVEGELDDFVCGEDGAADVAGSTVDAVVAVVDAGVGKEELEQGNAAAVRSIGVADA